MIYSNQGYAIVGAMLEKITGLDYETLITEKLFKPLRMDTAGFGPPGTTNTVDQPWGHVQKLFMTIPVQADNPPAIAPAGRVHCSLDDLARFAIFHLQARCNQWPVEAGNAGQTSCATGGREHCQPDGKLCLWLGDLEARLGRRSHLVAQWLKYDVVYRHVARAEKRFCGDRRDKHRRHGRGARL